MDPDDGTSERTTDAGAAAARGAEPSEREGRLAALGTLTACLAHELSNPLSFVIGNLEFAVREVTELALQFDVLERRAAEAAAGVSADGRGPGAIGTTGRRLVEVSSAIAEARAGALTLRRIVRDVLSFAKPEHQGDTRPILVERVVESAINLVGNQLRERARIVTTFGPTPTVIASHSRLTQVMVNLLVNAAHAIPPGDATRNEIRLLTRTDLQGRAVIEVCDTGSGISSENLSQVFDASFTTKPDGEGSGLGLTICRRIVTSLAGTIDVESAPGKGTTFRISLPPAPTAARLRTGGSVAPVGRRGKILVVDDDRFVVSALRRVLGREHDVTTELDGAVAMERLRRGERYDVILCDLAMPNMSGVEFHAALSRLDAALAARIVFVSGGASNWSEQAFADGASNAVVSKPFEVDALRELIRARVG